MEKSIDENVEQLQNAIEARRSLNPVKMSDRSIDKKVLLELIDAANWAPSHKCTEPWRFRIFIAAGRQKLSDAMVAAYRLEVGDRVDVRNLEKVRSRPLGVGAVVCLLAEFSGKVPEWHETAAIGGAVQNMHLLAHARGIGLYWTTPAFAEQPILRSCLDASERQRLLGVLYLGYPKENEGWPLGRRGAVEDKVIFYES